MAPKKKDNRAIYAPQALWDKVSQEAFNHKRARDGGPTTASAIVREELEDRYQRGLSRVPKYDGEQGATRNVYVPGDLWEKVHAEAGEKGIPASAIICGELEDRYARAQRKKAAAA